MEQNLNYYKIFYEAAKSGNISKAAEALYISQPAVSKSITKLEQSLGHTLFIRSKKGVKLTEEGKTLFGYLQQAFSSIDTAEQTLKQISHLGIGQLRIGVSTSLCKHILLSYLQDFIRENPHIKVSIDCNPTFETIQLLKQDKIDIGLICNTSLDKGYHFSPLLEIHDTFVTTQTYLDNLLLRERESFSDPTEKKQTSPENILERANLMLLDKENISRIFMETYFSTYHINPKQVLEINNMDLLIDFAAIGMGVACVVREFISTYLQNGQVIEINMTNPIPERLIGFVYAEHGVSTTANKFLEFCRHSAHHNTRRFLQ